MEQIGISKASYYMCLSGKADCRLERASCEPELTLS